MFPFIVAVFGIFDCMLCVSVRVRVRTDLQRAGFAAEKIGRQAGIAGKGRGRLFVAVRCWHRWFHPLSLLFVTVVVCWCG
jgi:hypothetical protein